MSTINNITKRVIREETLHNLEVKDDESYIANGIVVHNCRSFLEPIYKATTEKPEINNVVAPPSIQKQKSIY